LYCIKLIDRMLSRYTTAAPRGTNREAHHMTVSNTIALARSHLGAGNAGAYARIMAGAIRAAMSERTAKTYRAALIADGFGALAAQRCPIA
jgi:hypothetical protein